VRGIELFVAHLERSGRTLPRYVQREFEDYLKCGRLEYGFLRVRCTECHAEKLVAFSCKDRGFCPSCGARRMTESAALLVDEVLPQVPIRQWVLSVPYPIRFLFAGNPEAMGKALGVVYRCIAGFLLGRAGLTRAQGQCGAVTLIQRFGSALNLNVHFHMLIPDGVYLTDIDPPYSRALPAPSVEELQALVQRIAERLGKHLERRGLLVALGFHGAPSGIDSQPAGELDPIPRGFRAELVRVNYFFRWRLLFLPVLSLYHWSTIAQSDAKNVRSSVAELC